MVYGTAVVLGLELINPSNRGACESTHLSAVGGGAYAIIASSKVMKALGVLGVVIMVVSNIVWYASSKSFNEARTVCDTL